MDLEEIKTAIIKIKKIKGDDEYAHIDEDRLREDFIKWLALRDDSIGEMAKEILKTNNIKFSRWYA